MMQSSKVTILLMSSAILLGGCASVPREAGFPAVEAAVAERTGQRVRWNRLTAEDRSVDSAVRDLLARPLTADAVAQVALLNNRSLQATYEDLGIAQAEVVQAGLLRNPVFDGEVKFGEGGSGTAVEIAVVQDFLDVFFIPLRKRIAEDAFEATKLRVTGAVLDLAAQTRIAFYAHVAAEQTVEMRQTVMAATDASFDLARRLHAAGNISDLDLAQERALFEEAKVGLAEAEAAVLDSRERMNVLMGVWGTDTAWKSVKRLPDLPSEELALDDAERQAVERSLELAAARSEVQAAAATLGVQRSLGLLPEAEVGASAEREGDGEWAVGPALSLPIPLFDQGQARTAAADSTLQRARQQFIATAVEVRSAARDGRNRVLATRARANYFHQVILPLRREITERTQLQYNAMQIGAFQLLQAKEKEVEAGITYIEALRDYWTARTRMEQIRSGRVPSGGAAGMASNRAAGSSSKGRETGGH
jgi:cobalt-zinc-cadmium efflux system outer membrane protein